MKSSAADLKVSTNFSKTYLLSDICKIILVSVPEKTIQNSPEKAYLFDVILCIYNLE